METPRSRPPVRETTTRLKTRLEHLTEVLVGLGLRPKAVTWMIGDCRGEPGAFLGRPGEDRDGEESSDLGFVEWVVTITCAQ